LNDIVVSDNKIVNPNVFKSEHEWLVEQLLNNFKEGKFKDLNLQEKIKVLCDVIKSLIYEDFGKPKDRYLSIDSNKNYYAMVRLVYMNIAISRLHQIHSEEVNSWKFKK